MNDNKTVTNESLNTAFALLTDDTDFQVVAEDAPVMLWLTNAEGKVVFTNSRWKNLSVAARMFL